MLCKAEFRRNGGRRQGTFFLTRANKEGPCMENVPTLKTGRFKFTSYPQKLFATSEKISNARLWQDTQEVLLSFNHMMLVSALGAVRNLTTL